MSARKIIHIDLDAFFCSVEELLKPELRGKPFAVGGRPDQRGVVASCSYAARQFGVRSAMPMVRALQLCPQMLIVSSNFSAYSDYSKKVMAILHQYTDLIEQLSIDEAFLDVTDSDRDIADIALEMQTRIMTETGLPCSLGTASNKLVAKIATDAGKERHKKPTPPRSILHVPPGMERAFLAPLPVRALWGVGPKTAERLQSAGMNTIGDLAEAREATLIKLFGKNGYFLAKHAAGIDEREIQTEYEIKSISQEHTYNQDVADEKVLINSIKTMAGKVGERLRKKGFSASTVKLKIRWSNFETHTRQISFQQPFDQDDVVTRTAEQLFHEVWQKGKPVRLIGVGVSGFVEQVHQLNIWQAPDEKQLKLQDVMKEIEMRFGSDAIIKGSKLSTKKKAS